ncbi:MAG TPA: chemotaxis response regulator protein-glutamate methylesterase [Candidatus Sulfotelmatobacter sp.]|nr:chemotaxis response regulator protein-glutamate methylesterase [Candidatus Sulfotelmatobacter sp.]
MTEPTTNSPPGLLARVLVVDDSAFMRTALARMIASESSFEVVATACNGTEALEKIAALDPDVVTLDVEMPQLDGLATLRAIMSRFPRPVIMVSATTEQGAATTFNALSAGAFDYVPKRLSGTSLDIDHIRHDLIARIRAAALTRKSPLRDTKEKKPVHSSRKESRSTVTSISEIIAIGVSTGGPKALQEILPGFPRDLAVPLLIVQHMPEGFSAPFAERLNGVCSITVSEARQHEIIHPGTAYIAPSGTHMRVIRRSSDLQPVIALDTSGRSAQYVPSIDVLMKSVALLYKSRAMGIIMTGMGSDGAEGMKAIHRAGGLTIGQDEATCTVYGMPRVCAEMGILDRIVPLSNIPAQVMQAILRCRQA